MLKYSEPTTENCLKPFTMEQTAQRQLIRLPDLMPQTPTICMWIQQFPPSSEERPKKPQGLKKVMQESRPMCSYRYFDRKDRQAEKGNRLVASPEHHNILQGLDFDFLAFAPGFC